MLPVKTVCPTWNMAIVSKRSLFYKKEYIWDRGKVFAFLYGDQPWYTFWGMNTYLHKRDEKDVKERQRYRPKIVKQVGPDKWCANFVLAFKGKVKLLGDVVWLSERSSLHNLSNIEVEGIDASNMVLYTLGLDNFRYLEHLRYIKYGPDITDWYLFHLQHFKDSLEFVDVSGCKQITEAGIASLECLKNLKCLDLTGCTNIENPEALAVHMESLIPELVILGLETLSTSKELKISRFLTMGESADLRTDKRSIDEDRRESLYDMDANDYVTDRDTVNRVVT